MDTTTFTAITDTNQQRPDVAPKQARTGRPAFAEALRQAVHNSSERPAAVTPGPPGWIALGTISRNSPTVSDLLIRHPVYGKQCWQIVHGQQNHNAPYTRIPAGTTIYLHPGTLKIRWGRSFEYEAQQAAMRGSAALPGTAIGPAAGKALAAQLLGSLQAFLGTPYKDVDCYELLVNGLEKLGVQYRGAGGLKDHLIQAARRNGLPPNSYLTGEGLVANAGSVLYARTVTGRQQAGDLARQIYSELQDRLQAGYILSFSTPSRGHTGVVAKQGETWTFVNSGRLDHDINGGPLRKAVGEEYLVDEIRTWMARAARRGESLEITLGRLEENRLAAFIPAHPTHHRV